MTTAELFKAFGGQEAVMQLTGTTRNATNHWHVAGVPFRHWPILVETAAKAGIRTVTNASLATTRPKPVVRRAA